MRPLWGAVLVVVLAGCGQAEDGASDDADPASADAAGTADAADGEVEHLVGGDLEVPDWFPSPLPLPDGLRVSEVANDPAAQTMFLFGAVDGGDTAAIRARLHEDLQAEGYELLSESDGLAAFIKDGVGRVRVMVDDLEAEDGIVTSVQVTIDTWSDEQLDELRQTFAEEVVSTGHVTAVIDGETHEGDGECNVQGKRYWFATLDDPTFAVQIDETTDPPTVYADAHFSDQGLLYVPDPSMKLDREILSPTSPVGFAASGSLVLDSDESAEPVDVSFEVTCDG